jgi:hypothetical protein
MSSPTVIATAWGLARAGWDDLRRSGVATAIALVASLAAALALQAAGRRALADWHHASPGHAFAVVMLGAAVASLLLDCARAVALTAYAHPGEPFLARGLSRVPAMITITAVEITVEGFLGLALLLTVPRVLARGLGADAALACALVAAPVALLALVVFAAARVALVLAARGLAPARSLATGFDVVMRRLPSLVELAAVLALVTLPLALVGVALRFAGHAVPFAYAFLELAALWMYASLAVLVGRDPRLALG